MIALALGATDVDGALRVVRALGAHRYVSGRMHLVHALAFAAAGAGEPAGLDEGRAWARAVLADADVDAASRDERLWRRCTDAELVALLAAFWTPGDPARAARSALEVHLSHHDLEVSPHDPFDETHEEATHPLLVDAGWELVPLGSLDVSRHQGAIAAFGDALSFESACFEEETAIPSIPTLYELPAIGPVELLRGVDDEGRIAAPLVVWGQGHETYLDYVARGVRRAARLPEDGGS
jgi:hypothetical protein